MKMPPEVKPFLDMNLRDKFVRLAVEAEGGKILLKKTVFWQNTEADKRFLRIGSVNSAWAKLLSRLWKRLKVKTTEDVAHAQRRAMERRDRRGSNQHVALKPFATKIRIFGIVAHNTFACDQHDLYRAYRAAAYMFVRASARVFGLVDDHTALEAVLTLPEFKPLDSRDWQGEFYKVLRERLEAASKSLKIQAMILPSRYRKRTADVGDIDVMSWLIRDGANTVLVLDCLACDIARRLAWGFVDDDSGHSVVEGKWESRPFRMLPKYMRDGTALAHCLMSASLNRKLIRLEYRPEARAADFSTVSALPSFMPEVEP